MRVKCLWKKLLNTKSTSHKGKNKYDYIKLKKKIFTAKETAIKMKRQPMEQEKTYGKHVSNKELIPQIYKELTQLNRKNTNNAI